MSSKKDRDKRAERREAVRAWTKKKERQYTSTCIQLPEGVEFFKFDKAGKHKLDFAMFIAGKGNDSCDPGVPYFKRTYESHRVDVPGEGNRQFTCRKEFKKRCAVCDFLSSAEGKRLDKETRDKMRGKIRHLWLVNDKPGDKNNALKVLDTNHFAKGFGFGEMMKELLDSKEEYIDFADPIGGYTATLTVIEDTFPGGKWMKVTRIDLDKHSYDYPESMIDDAPCLDDCIVDPGYDAVMALLNPPDDDGPPDEPDEPDEPEERPVRTRSERTSSNGHDEEEEEKPKSRSRRRDEDDEDDEDDEPKSKSSRREEDDEDEEPKSRSRRSRDDEDEVDEDDEPVRGRSRR